MGLVETDDRAGDVGAAAGGQVRALVRVRHVAAAIARVSLPLTAGAAHLRGPCVFVAGDYR